MINYKRLILSLITTILLTAVSCNNAPVDRPILQTKSNAQNTIDPDAKTEEEIEQERLDKLARPDNAVKIESGFCACKESKTISWGSNCDNFCSDKADANATLYMNVSVTSDISERTDLGTFYNWCTKPIIDPLTEDTISEANCELEVKNSAGATQNLALIPLSQGSNTVKAVIDSLADDRTYRVKILETGSNVSSDTIQIRKTSIPITDPIGGPLWTLPISRYTCMNITTVPNDVSLIYLNASREYFYFNNETRPDPLTQIFANIYCHDIITFGSTPRNDPLLEETPGALTLWNALDPRFFDTDGDGLPQINQLLLQEVENRGASLPSAPNLFFKFQWTVGPDISTADNTGNGGTVTATAENADLGYYMTPWIDQTTFKSYCPNEDHYASSNQLFAAMKDIVGVATEGLYIAEQESGSSRILVRESHLKPIWFYTENGQNIEPNENSITGKKIQFFWPPDPTSPYIKKSHQKTFTVKRPSEIGDSVSQDSQGGNGVPTQYPAHDKKIGCIPKL